MKYFVIFFPELLLLSLFFILQSQHINADFWNDEIYTLKHFTFVSLSTTLTDYHVPNNHILFNFINNIYLKIININSFNDLMETPYKLRIIPFIYSFFTVVYTYFIGKKFMNRSIAILSVLFLITTIPFISFSLQIRGYGLSSLLIVMIVFYSLSYLQSIKRNTLVKIFVLTGLLIFTIPSNLYPLIAIIFSYGIYYIVAIVRDLQKNKNTLRHFFLDKNLKIIAIIILGISVALLFYLPIFKAVFMNEYVVPGESFEWGKLKFYTDHVFLGLVSNRWGILILSFFGFIFGLRYYKQWNFQVVLLSSLCILPILIVFIHGDKAPLRIFSVLPSFFSLFLAIGLYSLWNRFTKDKIIINTILFLTVLVYSTVIFVKENQKIKAHLLNDMRIGDRSQDFYYQYYSVCFNPLKDIKAFKNVYEKDKLPVLILDCEPHGIPNYLKEFNIPFYKSNALDSLMINSNKIYTITNHPNSFKNIKEYKITRLNSELSYHNVLVVKKNKEWFKFINSKIDSLKKQYKDSINFIFKTNNNSLYKEITNCFNSYFISADDPPDFGSLLQFSKSKPYLCYLETQNSDSEKYNTIVKDNFYVLNDFIDNERIQFYFGLNSTEEINDENVLYFNSFDDLEKENIQMYSLDSLVKFSSKYSVDITNNVYSQGYSFNLKKIEKGLFFKVSFQSIFIKESKGVVVIEINRKNKKNIWLGSDINTFYNSSKKWNKVISIFKVDEELTVDDKINIFIWNPAKENMRIDDFKIEMK